jgi:hypothetical protein
MAVSLTKRPNVSTWKDVHPVVFHNDKFDPYMTKDLRNNDLEELHLFFTEQSTGVTEIF